MTNFFKRLWLTLLWWIHKPIYSWVKAQVLPDALPGSLGLDHDMPVVYALRTRSFSDHAVLEGLARDYNMPRPQSLPSEVGDGSSEMAGSCIYIERPEAHGWFRLRRGRGRHRPTRIERLTEAAAADFAFDAQIVPVSIFWGRDPGKEESMLRLLVTDVENAGPLRKFFIVLLQGRRVFVNFGQPLRLREFIEHGVDPERLPRKLARVLRVHFRQQRVATLGPGLSSRRTVINALLGSETVLQAIQTEVAGGKDEASERLRARKYAEEIAADLTFSTIRILDRLLGWFWNRIFDGIVVHHTERLRNIATSHEVVYMPSHRSHLDYLLMSYVLYYNGLVPPHIAAGINMNFWPMGGTLRRGGAFYLRRSFNGNELYSTVFREYMHMLLTRGYSVNFYTEGGRSRTGRLLAPRAGLLGMTVDSFLRDAQRPIVLVPVYVGYDRLMEASSYAKELRGGSKKKESIFELLKLVKVLKQSFGKAHLSFGKPVHLGEYLDEQQPNWREDSKKVGFDDSWVKPVVNDLANKVMRRINAAAVVNPIGLLGLALLAEPAHTLGERELAQRIDGLLALLKRLRYSDDIVIDENLTGATVIDEAAPLIRLERIAHPWGDLLAVTGKSAAQLTYYRNNLQHLVVLPGLVASLLHYDDSRTRTEIEDICLQLYPLLQVEFTLRWTGDEVATIITDVVDGMVELGLLAQVNTGGALRRNSRKTAKLSRPSSVDPRFGDLLALGRTVRETLERYCMISALLMRNEQLGMQLDQKGLIAEVETLAQRLNLLSAKDSPEFADKALFRSHLQSLRERGLLIEDNGVLKLDARLRGITDQALELLGLDAQQMLIPLLQQPAAAQAGEANDSGEGKATKGLAPVVIEPQARNSAAVDADSAVPKDGDK